MESPDLYLALAPVMKAFEELNIEYAISGSVGSSLHGLARATLDVDVVTNLKENHVSPLVLKLKNDFYIDEDMIHSALKTKVSFNIIHLKTMLKIDIFILKNRSFDKAAFKRRSRKKLFSNDAYYVMTPEDLILHKLEWYEKGKRISNQQRKDIAGIIQVQGKNLDLAYLNDWASKLNLKLLLQSIQDEIK